MPSREGGLTLRLQLGGSITVQKAWVLQASKAEQTTQKQLRKEARAASLVTTQAKKKLYRAGVEARKEERPRKKRVIALWKAGEPIPPEDQEPIIDLEVEAEIESRELNRSRRGSGSGSGSKDGNGSNECEDV